MVCGERDQMADQGLEGALPNTLGCSADRAEAILVRKRQHVGEERVDIGADIADAL